MDNQLKSGYFENVSVLTMDRQKKSNISKCIVFHEAFMVDCSEYDMSDEKLEEVFSKRDKPYYLGFYYDTFQFDIASVIKVAKGVVWMEGTWTKF